MGFEFEANIEIMAKNKAVDKSTPNKVLAKIATEIIGEIAAKVNRETPYQMSATGIDKKSYKFDS